MKNWKEFENFIQDTLWRFWNNLSAVQFITEAIMLLRPEFSIRKDNKLKHGVNYYQAQ